MRTLSRSWCSRRNDPAGDEQLEKTEEKIVFVVDEKSRMVGSLTDGDIRRWILSMTI